MKKLFFILFLILSVSGFTQTTYYVSNSGNDSNTGTSSSAPWQTIAKVNTTTFSPGDSILFKAGDTWREQLAISNDGASSASIVYSSYGSDNKPQLYGSTAITTWTNETGNIWSGDQSVSTDPWGIGYGAQIFFETVVDDTLPKWGVHQTYNASFSNLTSEYDWTWNGSKIYIYSPTDPNTRYVKVECPQRENEVELGGHAYITFNNLDIRYTASSGIHETYGIVGVSGLRVTYCRVGNIGYKGSSKAFGLSVTNSNMYIANNVMHDCGRRNISINLYATTPVGTMQNVVIEKNLLYNGWHTTGVDCINSGDHLIDSVIIRNNLVKGDTAADLTVDPNSNGFFVANQTSGSGIIQNVYVYNNILLYAHGKQIAFENIDTGYIVNNTIYRWNPTISNGQNMISLSSPGNRNVYVKNNIVYNDGDNSYNNALNTVMVTDPEESIFLLDYNLYYNTDGNQTVLEFYEPGSYDDEYTMSQWSTYLSAKSPNDANSPTPSDPLFIEPANEDFHLQATSPARDAGTPVFFVTTDYEGNLRSATTPSIGAYEYVNPDSTQAYIVTFTIPNQVSSTVDTTAKTVSVVMPYGTDVTSLTPTITVCYAATISPASGVTQNFSSPINYTVTSGDGTVTNIYIATVTTQSAQPTDNVRMIRMNRPVRYKGYWVITHY